MRTKQDRAEIPCGTGFQPDRTTGPSLSDTHTMWDAHREPINEYDALMRCDFDEYPEEPKYPEELITMVEGILTPKELAVVNFLVYGGMSLAVAGRYLGEEFPRKDMPTPYSKMAVTQLRNSAFRKIETFLLERMEGYEQFS